MRVAERQEIEKILARLNTLEPAIRAATKSVDRAICADEIARIRLRLDMLLEDSPHDTP